MVERAVEDSVVLVGTPLGTHRATSSSSLDTVSGSVSGGAGELLRRFPALRAAVVAAATGALDAHRRESERMVEALVDMEASYFDADFFRRFTREQQQQRDAEAEDEVVGKKSTANGSGKVVNFEAQLFVPDSGQRQRRRDGLLQRRPRAAHTAIGVRLRRRGAVSDREAGSESGRALPGGAGASPVYSPIFTFISAERARRSCWV